MRLFKVLDTAFENFDRSVRLFLSKSFSSLGLEYSHSQIFGVIFDGMKGIMQNIMFYIEDAFTEQNIFRATRKQSIYSLAKLSGYEPYYGSAACGTLFGYMNINSELNSKTTKIYIRDHSILENSITGIQYMLDLGTNFVVIDIAKPLVSYEFKIVQGTMTRATYIANGYELETIRINSTELYDSNYITVRVNGEKWSKVNSLYDMGENTTSYMISTGFDNGFDVMFGDGIHGVTLNPGDSVTIDYLRHSGNMGNINPGEATEFIMTTPGYDTMGNMINVNDYVKFTVPNCISGGTNSDSISFIRNIIGTNSRSGVLVSEENFKLFFRRFSFIGYVNCWAEPNSLSVVATCLRNISAVISSVDDYYNMPIEDMTLTNEQKLMIQNTLDNSNKSFAGITLKFQDPIIRRYAVVCYVKIDNVYNKEATTMEINRLLGEYFMNLQEGVDFIPKSDIITTIVTSVTSVIGIDIDFISELAEQTYKNGYYDKWTYEYANGGYQYVSKRVIYEKDVQPGLDGYGNITLDSKLEIPLLRGGFNYYINKDSNSSDKNDMTVVPTTQIFYI